VDTGGTDFGEVMKYPSVFAYRNILYSFFFKQYTSMKNTLLCLFLLTTLIAYSQTAFDQKATVAAAKALISTLNTAQKDKVCLGLNDTSRFKWSNFPMETAIRQGLWWNDLADSQKMHIHALIRSVLSVQGYQKALFIIQYDEDIKQRLTAAKSPIAHRYGQEKYWITIFGDPDVDKTWAWKFEGHHLSLNFTHTPKGVTCTPMFIGINPALTTAGAFAGRYIMQDENELGKQLFSSLTPILKKKAILSTHPTNADPLAQTGKEDFIKEKTGITYADMNKTQQEMVVNIIKAWVDNINPALASEKLSLILKNKETFRFAWYGTEDVTQLHYYRIFSPTFIVELTNRDGGIQHLHSLWRNLDEDFTAKK
jgi:hypothetical protein